MCRLENWSVVALIQNPYMAPEARGRALTGRVYDDPRFENGTTICTTALVGVSGQTVTTRSGSVYELGEVDPAYEVTYPDALNRLQAAFDFHTDVREFEPGRRRKYEVEKGFVRQLQSVRLTAAGVEPERWSAWECTGLQSVQQRA